MDKPKKKGFFSEKQLKLALQHETADFKKTYLWLEENMPSSFFEEMEGKRLVLITHNLMSLHLQDNFSQINFREGAVVLCPDSMEADVAILKHYEMHGIHYYRSFTSKAPLPQDKKKRPLKVTHLLFTDFVSQEKECIKPEEKEEIFAFCRKKHPNLTKEEFSLFLDSMNPRFLLSMNPEKMEIALNLFFEAQKKESCQYFVRYFEDWKEQEIPSMQIVMAWKNVPKYRFLLNLSEMILRHKLDLQRVTATYVTPYAAQSVLILSLAIHGNQKSAWEEADIPDFLRELCSLKFAEKHPSLESAFIKTGYLTGNEKNLLSCILTFVHQILLNLDPNLYSLSNIEEGFCRHQDLTVQLCEIFSFKFHPEKHNLSSLEKTRTSFIRLVDNLDTGHPSMDKRRKNILKQALNFIDHTVKTNFYQEVKTSFSFRLSPLYLENVPFSRKERFPVLPYGIFYIKGPHFVGFHVRFKDLSRGGLRTLVPEKVEQFVIEKNQIFSECYNLGLTQQKKNKDIPEGGSKGVILLEPFEKMYHELLIYKKEMETAKLSSLEIEENLKSFTLCRKKEHLHEAQKSFIHSFLTLINCEESGLLKENTIVDYYKKPEYIFLGPDENMHNEVIQWISELSFKQGYSLKKSFITSKPGLGINHKEFGVTSLGVLVYVEQVLLYLGIDPAKDPFTIKISGGPDGDVAGNMIHYLYKKYPKTAKLIALTDVSGTIFDAEGLSLEEMEILFQKGLPIRFYPPEKLSEGGFLLDRFTKREQTAYIQQTLCYRKKEGALVQDWLSGSDMNHLFRYNVHQAIADIFVPAGGRPRTLHEENYTDFLNEKKEPSSRAIVEGANLYITQEARRILESLGVLIIKDSSANKGGVICSSFEVLSTLVLEEKEFLEEKETLVFQILEILKKKALDEALLLLDGYEKEKIPLTECSEKISEKINTYKYEILDYLEKIPLSSNKNDPFIRSLFHHAPPLLQEKYGSRLLTKISEVHKKAIIACYIASSLVYKKGFSWSPSIVDILPLLSLEEE